MQRGRPSGTATSAAPSNGTSRHPRRRAARAGYSAVRSGDDVKIALSTSSGWKSFACCNARSSSSVAARIASRVFAAALVAPRSPRRTLLMALESSFRLMVVTDSALLKGRDPVEACRRAVAGLDWIAPLEEGAVRDHHQAQARLECHEQSSARAAGRDQRCREHPRSDPGGDGRAAPDAAAGKRLPAGGRRERDLHVVPRPHGRVPGPRRATPRVARRPLAGRRRGGRAGRSSPLHPRAAPLLYRQDAGRAETYVPAGGGQAATRPNAMTVVVSAQGAARWQGGHPWIYRTDVYDEPGDSPGIVTVTNRRGRHLGQALYSPKSEIRLRLLTQGRESVDAGWWGERIAAAAARRAGIPATAYRIVHAEGDGLPSLVVDRYGPYVVAQLLSAGLERVRDDVIAGIRAALGPEGVLLRNDAPIRRHEGLPLEVVPAFGTVPELVEVEEHGIRYFAAPHTGQKTGAFLDQRENRALVGAHTAEGRALDLFTYHGSFALPLARRAGEVVAV